MKINYLPGLPARPFSAPSEWNSHAKRQKPQYNTNTNTRCTAIHISFVLFILFSHQAYLIFKYIYKSMYLILVTTINPHMLKLLSALIILNLKILSNFFQPDYF